MAFISSFTALTIRPRANQDRAAAGEDGPTFLSYTRLMANDVGVGFSFHGIDQTDFTQATTSAVSRAGAALSLTGDGRIQYDPALSTSIQALSAGQTLQDSFFYTIRGTDSRTSAASVLMTVAGANDAPAVVSETLTRSLSGGGATSGSLSTSGTIRFRDPDLADAHVVSVSPASGVMGRLSLTSPVEVGASERDVQWTYTVDAANLAALAAPRVDAFAVRIADLLGSAITRTVQVTLSAANDAPTVVGQPQVAGRITAVQTSGTPGTISSVADGYLRAGRSLIDGLGNAGASGPGFGEQILARNDDSSSAAIDITPVFGAQGLNFFGARYTSLYLNNNGNLTFGSPTGTYTPSAITAGLANPIIAAFWADVDTNGGVATRTPGGGSAGTNLVYWDIDSANGVFTATWDDVGYYYRHIDKLNAFQIQLISRGNGDFDIVYRYEDIDWTTGDASNGTNGLGGTPARAGYSAGDNNPQHYFELPQSGNQQQMLALETTRGNTGITGVHVFNVRSGQVVPDLTTSGQIQFADVNRLDTHSAAVRFTGTGTPLGSLTAQVQQDAGTTTGSGGTVTWRYDVNAATLAAALGATGQRQESFEVTVADGFGGSVSQTVTVSLFGYGTTTATSSALTPLRHLQDDVVELIGVTPPDILHADFLY